MANKYLLSSQPDGGSITYFTANASGDLVSIGSTYDMAQGFTDTELALLNNDDYKTLDNGKLWIESDTSSYTMNVTSLNEGYIESTETTNIDLAGYSGINNITINGTGGKVAISFDDRVTWLTYTVSGYVVSDTTCIPVMVSNTSPSGVAAASSEANKNAWEAFNNNGYWYQANVTSGWVSYTSLSAKLIKRYSVRAPSDGDTSMLSNMMKSWTVEYLNGATWTVLDTQINQTGWTSGEVRTFDIAVPVTATAYRVNISASNGTYCACSGSIKMYDATEEYAWQTISAVEIPVKGMTLAKVNALTFADYAPVFKRTQLDFHIHLTGTETVTNLTVSLPPNAAPVISDFTASKSTIHKENVDVSFKVTDAEGETATYKVDFNGTEMVATTNVPVSGIISMTIPGTSFNLGTNSLKVTATDPRGATSESTIYITKNDAAPTVVGVLNGNIYRATLGDADNDKVQYRVIFNGEVLTDWTELFASPYTLNYTIPRTKIKYNQTNTLVIDVMDDMGASSSTTEQFVGTFYGLLFSDPSDNSFYSNDIGEVIKKLGFGDIVANGISQVKEIKLVNKTGNGLAGVAITVPEELRSSVRPQLSLDQTNFDPKTNLAIGAMSMDESKSFYARIVTDKDSVGGGDFYINVTSATV